MRIVTNKELSNYKVLPFDIYTEERSKILEAGEVLTPGKLIMLKNYLKIFTEDYNDEIKNDSEKVDGSNGNIPSHLLHFTFDTIDSSEFETVINKDGYVKTQIQVKIKYYYKRILELLYQGYYKEAISNLKNLVSILKTEVYKKISHTGKGSKIRFMGEYELCHPLNVAVISGLIANRLEYASSAIDQVILAGLLHDIGKVKIDMPEHQALLTTNEGDVKNHTIIGYKMIKEEFDLAESIAKVALEHHENNDGSGYPKGLSSDYIHEFSQIVNVANYYDNLAFNRTHTIIASNKDALRYMLEVGTKKFSAKMLYTFVNMFEYDDSKSFNDMAV